MSRTPIGGAAFVEVGVISDAGSRYDHNEDSHWYDPQAGLFVIADGIGGAPGGEVASRMAVDSIRRFLQNGPQGSLEERLRGALMHAHQSVRGRAAEDRDLYGMGTTALIAWWLYDENTVWTAHVGNSRAFRSSPGSSQLDRLTDDHTLFEVVHGAGSPQAAAGSWPPRNLLSQSIGGSELIAPEVRPHEFHDGNLLLLCTDGITEVVEAETLVRLCDEAKDPQALCERIGEMVFASGAPDNFTALAVSKGVNGTSSNKGGK